MAVTRRIGASSHSNAFSLMRMAISPAMPPGARVLVHEQHAVRLLHRLDDRVLVQRQQCAQVEDLDLEPSSSSQLLGRLRALVHHHAVRHDREILPLPVRARLAQRDRLASGSSTSRRNGARYSFLCSK
jgi:hypothetical protein